MHKLCIDRFSRHAKPSGQPPQNDDCVAGGDDALRLRGEIIPVGGQPQKNTFGDGFLSDVRIAVGIREALGFPMLNGASSVSTTGKENVPIVDPPLPERGFTTRGLA